MSLLGIACGLLLSTPFSATWARDVNSTCPVPQAAIETAIERSEALLDRFVENIKREHNLAATPGFGVAVSVCGKPVWQASRGYSDLENRVPVTAKTKFRIGSVSKPLTAAALGQLAEQGKLDLDAEIQTYVPRFPRKKYPIKDRQLAGHVAVIRHYMWRSEFLSTKHYKSVKAGLDIFKKEPLLFEPGSAYFYSSFGWNLLAAAVEGAVDQAFLSYMHDNVFVPAGMSSTVADVNHQLTPDRTRFYAFEPKLGGLINAPYVDNSNKWAGGGFLSTPSDLLKFAQAMSDGTLVSQETYQWMTSPQTLNSGETIDYGIGWRLNMRERMLKRAQEVYAGEVMARTRQLIANANVIGHGGGSVGGKTTFLRIPDAPGQVVVAAALNNSDIRPVFALPVAAEFLAASSAAAPD